MPLKIKQVRGKPVGLYLALLGVGVSTPPSVENIVVGTGGAAAGDNAIPVEALPVAIPKNTILTFSRAAGDPATVTVVVTADAAAAATSLSVEAFEGEEGAGLPAALAAADSASYDGLFTVAGTENSPYTNNPQTQDLNAVVYGSASGVSVSNPEVTSVSPQMARTGLFLSSGQLVKDIIQYADTNRLWYARQVTPDDTGAPFMERTGLCKVSDLNEDKPADNLLRLSYTIRFTEKPTITWLGA